MIDPQQSDEMRPDRDAAGRWLPGHRQGGPGRPEGSCDLRAIARRWAEQKGTTLADELARVVDAVVEQAQAGDLRAAYLVFKHLPDEPVDDAGRGANLEQLIAETVSQGEREARIRAILASASMREELDRQRPVLQVETGVPPADDEGEQSR